MDRDFGDFRPTNANSVWRGNRMEVVDRLPSNPNFPEKHPVLVCESGAAPYIAVMIGKTWYSVALSEV